MRKITGILLFLLSPLLIAQTPPSNLTGEVKKLDFLIGKWKGERRTLRIDGSWGTLNRACEVKGRKDGLALRFTCKDWIGSGSGSGGGYLVDVTILYSETERSYRWGRGPEKDFAEAALIEPRALRLSFKEPSIRDTITVTEDGDWREVIEWRDQSRGWYKAEEITLKRIR
jgi:hypothetical protein